MTDLRDRLLDTLREHPGGLTVPELARLVRVRAHDVRQAVQQDDRFSGPVSSPDRSPKARVYLASNLPPDGSGRVRGGGWPRVQPGSQNARILDVLADREWHSTAAIHRAAGFSRLNSRIAELRPRGYVIEHRGEGFGADLHEYRLISSPLDETASQRAPLAVSSSGGGSATSEPSPGADGQSPPLDSQLELQVA